MQSLAMEMSLVPARIERENAPLRLKMATKNEDENVLKAVKLQCKTVRSVLLSFHSRREEAKRGQRNLHENNVTRRAAFGRWRFVKTRSIT